MPLRTCPHLASRRAGFTLIEMLISLVVIGIMAMAIAPSLSEVLSNNRQASAAMDLVRLGRQARARAISTGVAQLLWFQQDGGSGFGTIDQYQGMNNRCLQTPWADAVANTSLAFSMATYNPNRAVNSVTHQVIFLTAAAAGTAVTALRLCYQPDGQIYNDLNPVNQMTPQANDIDFTITRKIGGQKHGTDRVVRFPVGGNARLN